jgi:hypothetical protein
MISDNYMKHSSSDFIKPIYAFLSNEPNFALYLKIKFNIFILCLMQK